jgi:hypothetical protein
MPRNSYARKRNFDSYRPNRHPADRLAELRQAEKSLRDEIEEVRQEILANPRDLIGDEHSVTIDYREHVKVDTAALIADFGQDNKYILQRNISPWILSKEIKR